VDLELAGQTVLITGGSKGIGYACAETFLAEGCQVAVVARDSDGGLAPAVEKLRETGGDRILGLTGDMSKGEEVARVVREVLDRWENIDVLVTCAGSSPGGLLEDLTEEQWMSSLNLKFMGYVRTVREVIPHMRERGSGTIVLVVGNDGLKPSYWEMTAGVANAADLNFASSLAEQYGRHGVRVNTINPGPVATTRWDTLEKAFARDKGVDQARAHELALGSLPLGRICTAQEVADVVTFVASPRASYLHGAHIPLDGGQRKALMDI
jgi:3-oxoacyl-[acyl-carrier protein] reductase